MSDKNPDVKKLADEKDLIDQLEGESGRELSEQKKNLAIAQATLIGDLC